MTIDLQKQAIKEFELKDVQKLLEKVKTSDNLQLTEDLLKKLDKNHESLSETEKTLYEQSKEAINIINFLEWIIKNLEKKDNKTVRWFTAKIENQKTNKEDNKETKIIENILWKNINNIDENKINKLNNKQIKILLSLQIISNSICEAWFWINKIYQEINDLLLNKLKTNIEKQLLW